MRHHLSLFTIVVLVFTAAANAQNPVAYTVTDLGTLGGPFTSSTATGINNRGEVVGYSYYEICPPIGSGIATIIVNRPFIYDGAMHDLGVANAVTDSIDDRGQIVGYSFDFGSFIATKKGGSYNSSPLFDPQLGLTDPTALTMQGRLSVPMATSALSYTTRAICLTSEH